jgi:hypothetical protein
MNGEDYFLKLFHLYLGGQFYGHLYLGGQFYGHLYLGGQFYG